MAKEVSGHADEVGVDRLFAAQNETKVAAKTAGRQVGTKRALPLDLTHGDLVSDANLMEARADEGQPKGEQVAAAESAPEASSAESSSLEVALADTGAAYGASYEVAQAGAATDMGAASGSSSGLSTAGIWAIGAGIAVAGVAVAVVASDDNDKKDDAPVPPTPAVTSVTPNVTAVDEGKVVEFKIVGTAGDSFSYSLSGVSANDVTGTPLSGTITIGADGTATLSVSLAADATTEGAESLKLTVGTVSSAAVTVNDTSTTPVPPTVTTITPSATTVSEGSSVTFEVTGTNLAGQTISYTLSGVDQADVGQNLTGTITFDSNGKGTLTVTALADGVFGETESLKLTVGGVTSTVAITDTTPPPPNPDLHTLTTGADIVTGTTFTAPADFNEFTGTYVNTLQNIDELTGKAGSSTDVLNAKLVDTGSTGPVAPVLNDVEILNIQYLGSSATTPVVLDLARATGVEQINMTSVISAFAQAINIDSTAVALSVSDATLDASVAFDYRPDALKGASDTVTIGLANADLDTLFVGEGYTDGVETLSLNVTKASAVADIESFDVKTLNVAAGADFTLGFVDAVVSTVNVSGAGNVKFDGPVNFAGTTAGFVLDASKLTGALTLDVAQFAGDAKVTSGAGADVITSAGDLKATVSTGAGADKVTVTGNLTGSVDVGSGANTVAVSGVLATGSKLVGGDDGNTLSATSVKDGASVTTGAGADTLTLKGGIEGDLNADKTVSTVKLGAGSDTLAFVLGNAAGPVTLIGDKAVIDGGDGSDTLAVSAFDNVTLSAGSPVITGIETLSLTSKSIQNDNDAATADYTVDASKFDSALKSIALSNESGWYTDSKGTVFNGDAAVYTVTGLGTGTSVTLTSAETEKAANTNTDATLNLALAADTVNDTATVALSGDAAFDAAINDSAAKIENLNLAVAGSAAHTVDLTGFASKLTVSGSGTGALEINNIDANTVDTTAYAGNVTLDINGDANFVVNTGAGNDTIELLGNVFDGADKIDGGAGTDRLVINGFVAPNEEFFENIHSIEELQAIGVLVATLDDDAATTGITKLIVGDADAGFGSVADITLGSKFASNFKGSALEVVLATNGSVDTLFLDNAIANVNVNIHTTAEDLVFYNGTAASKETVEFTVGTTGGAAIDNNDLFVSGGASIETITFTSVASSADSITSVSVQDNWAKGTLLLDGSGVTKGALNIDGSLETDAVLTIKGSSGGDDLQGGALADTLDGAAGNDKLRGGKGDKLTGGTGSDVFVALASLAAAGAALDVIDFKASEGDTIDLSTFIGNDSLAAASGFFAGTFSGYTQALAGLSSSYENTHGPQAVFQADTHTLWVDLNADGNLNTSDVQIHLDSSVTTLTAADLGIFLAASGTINATRGDDYIVLKTTAGADTIKFSGLTESANGSDHVYNFNAAEDKASFSLDAVKAATGDASLVAGGLSAANFSATGVATDANDYFVFNNATGELSFDADGNGAGAAVVIATFDPATTLGVFNETNIILG